MLKLTSSSHIVMVDDNAGDLFFVEQCYRASRLKNPWLPVSAGPAFLQHLARVKAGEFPTPALVLLDINMPNMTGLEVLAATRADSYFDKVPIFCVLTSSNDPRERERALELGASGFRNKSCTFDECVAFFNALAE